MRNDVNNLPHWIWFTAMFLYRADKAREETPTKSIEEVYNDFLRDQRLDQNSGFQLRNQGTSMMLAYGLLVLPREIWDRDDLPSFEFNTKTEFKFIIDDVHAQTQHSQFIRCMRNSISHANVNIIAPAETHQRDTFTFWNYNLRNQCVDFKVSSSWKGFLSFLDEVAKYYINTVKPFFESCF
jgi:hypothetical protein